MTTLSTVQVARFAAGVGFTGPALVTITAIAHAESGNRTDAIGDRNLTEPGEESVGLWQINYRPSRDRKGGLRDPTLNLDGAHNATAAFVISGRGQDFTPWSTYTSGAYRAFVAEAQAAVLEISSGGSAKGVDVAKTVVAAAVTPSGKGYWQFTDDGGVFAFGDAIYLGGVQIHPDGTVTAVHPGAS